MLRPEYSRKAGPTSWLLLSCMAHCHASSSTDGYCISGRGIDWIRYADAYFIDIFWEISFGHSDLFYEILKYYVIEMCSKMLKCSWSLAKMHYFFHLRSPNRNVVMMTILVVTLQRPLWGPGQSQWGPFYYWATLEWRWDATTKTNGSSPKIRWAKDSTPITANKLRNKNIHYIKTMFLRDIFVFVTYEVQLNCY